MDNDGAANPPLASCFAMDPSTSISACTTRRVEPLPSSWAMFCSQCSLGFSLDFFTADAERLRAGADDEEAMAAVARRAALCVGESILWLTFLG